MNNQNVPSVPKVDGNNVSSTLNGKDCLNAQYIYDFVINNYTESEVCQLKLLIPNIAKKARFGLEVGESGTPHIQGYISLLKKERYTGLQKNECFKRASFRKCRNEPALIEYVSKGTDIWSYGFPVELKIIKNLYPWQQKIEDIFFTEPDDRTIRWYWEGPGCRGKSQFCKYMAYKHKAVCVRGGKLADLMNIVFNTDMDKCRMIMFDLPRNTGNKISYTSLEAIKDGFITNTKYETGIKFFNPPHVIVFANVPPNGAEHEMSADKLVVEEL